MKYKLMKVFDCQDMPDDVRKDFFDACELCNDVCTQWFIGYCSESVNRWLLENGATEEDEKVIIKHWW
jgi:hypothetical protein